jgi:hypothetical protein
MFKIQFKFNERLREKNTGGNNLDYGISLENFLARNLVGLDFQRFRSMSSEDYF